VIPHIDIVQALEEQLGFRHIAIASEEYAVTKDGKNFFGVMTLDQGIDGAQFALGVRNSHSKQFRLSIVVGMRIFVCSNLSFAGDFNIVLAKHSKNLNLKHSISIGIDEAQRGFEPMQIQVSAWKEIQVSDDQARLAIFKAFVEDQLDAPKHLARKCGGTGESQLMRSFARGRPTPSRTLSPVASNCSTPCRCTARQPTSDGSSKGSSDPGAVTPSSTAVSDSTEGREICPRLIPAKGNTR